MNAENRVNNTESNTNLPIGELLEALMEMKKINTSLEQENHQLKVSIAAQNNQIDTLNKELTADGQRIDFLLETVAMQAEENNLLVTSLKGDMPIIDCNMLAVNDEDNEDYPLTAKTV